MDPVRSLARDPVASPKDLGGATSYGMDIREIKKLVKNSTAVLVMDDNEPTFVVMDYQIYKDLTRAEDQADGKGPAREIKVKNASGIDSVQAKSSQREGELEILERINKEILVLKDEIEKEEKSLFPASNI